LPGGEGGGLAEKSYKKASVKNAAV